MNYIDLSYVREISAGDDQFIANLIQSFLRSTPRFREEFRHREQRKNRQELQAVTHRLKSAALYLGLHELVRILGAIEEHAASEPGGESLPPLLLELELVLEASLSELRTELEKLTDITMAASCSENETS